MQNIKYQYCYFIKCINIIHLIILNILYIIYNYISIKSFANIILYTLNNIWNKVQAIYIYIYIFYHSLL